MAVSHNPQLADWVNQVLEARGNPSLRQVERETRISFTTALRMRQGRVPGVEQLLAFARAYRQDVVEALQIAGYPEVARAIEEVAARRYEAGRLRPAPAWYDESRLTEEDKALLQEFYAFLVYRRDRRTE